MEYGFPRPVRAEPRERSHEAGAVAMHGVQRLPETRIQGSKGVDVATFFLLPPSLSQVHTSAFCWPNATRGQGQPPEIQSGTQRMQDELRGGKEREHNQHDQQPSLAHSTLNCDCFSLSEAQGSYPHIFCHMSPHTPQLLCMPLSRLFPNTLSLSSPSHPSHSKTSLCQHFPDLTVPY